MTLGIPKVVARWQLIPAIGHGQWHNTEWEAQDQFTNAVVAKAQVDWTRHNVGVGDFD